ncbi:MAG: homoserine kinase [Azonexus sp.]|uniref:homoserine kinase n=1 Tax=Azonexus sp. TaxID=1872668 RepID=UPI00282260EC|nr:homoserine kinase [Azonexus sp.]MDR0777473.1 homoserine kinase [Azonexus sp.]
MSVYTLVGREELAAWLQPLGVGELREHAGIAAGMQNSNYFVDTAGGRFVLTLFELPFAQGAVPELDFYLALLDHLASRGLPCPRPLADAAGRRWRPLAGKPAALLSRLPGHAIEAPDAGQCRAVGRLLGELHVAAADFPAPPPNPCGADWCRRVGAALLPRLNPDEAALLQDELAFQAARDDGGLPRGVIHADLFRDNVLWDAGRPSGVLDFYFAGADCLLLDLAVAANDWCASAEELAALVAGYRAVRPLSEAEAAAWPALRRAAALRFWLLRLGARYQPRAGEVVTVKDPDHFRRLLENLRLAPAALPR